MRGTANQGDRRHPDPIVAVTADNLVEPVPTGVVLAVDGQTTAGEGVRSAATSAGKRPYVSSTRSD